MKAIRHITGDLVLYQDGKDFLLMGDLTDLRPEWTDNRVAQEACREFGVRGYGAEFDSDDACFRAYFDSQRMALAFVDHLMDAWPDIVVGEDALTLRRIRREMIDLLELAEGVLVGHPDAAAMADTWIDHMRRALSHDTEQEPVWITMEDTIQEVAKQEKTNA